MGDMDFKIAGTSKGVTALQADIKLPGIPLRVVMEAIQQATEAKTDILSLMYATLPAPRHQHKDNMPALEDIPIPAHKRARVMGPGGIHMRRIQAVSGVQVRTV